MEQWIYNNQLVASHSLYSACQSTLNGVSNRDYPNTNYFNPAIKCLDVDFYEKQVLCTSHPDNTVDAVIGISSFENNKATNPHLLLIELRMNYQSTNSLSKAEMERKVTHTKALLGGECPIKKECLFIFNDSIAPQAVSWFSRQSRTGGELKHCTVCSTTSFSDKVKSSSDFPYTPIHPKENILNSTQPYCKSAEWDNFMKQVKFWCKKACEYQYKNPSEYEHIKDVITEIWQDFKHETHSLCEEEEFEMELLEEEFELLLMK